MSDAPHLLVEVQDRILIATFNRPEKLNALSGDLMGRFEQAIHEFRDNPDLKVMLIRAKGRYFCAGVDLTQGAARNTPRAPSAIRENHRLRIHGMHRIYDEMEAIEKPIVVAHHAPCVGGGLEMSLSCDYRLAAKGAHYSFPESKMGILPASNGVSRLTRIVGTHWTRYMIAANMKVSAERALIMGLVHEVWEDSEFEANTMEFCRHLASLNGEQMGTAKLAIEMARDVGLAQARNVERLANSALMLHPDYIEAWEAHAGSIGSRKQG